MRARLSPAPAGRKIARAAHCPGRPIERNSESHDNDPARRARALGRRARVPPAGLLGLGAAARSGPRLVPRARVRAARALAAAGDLGRRAGAGLRPAPAAARAGQLVGHAALGAHLPAHERDRARGARRGHGLVGRAALQRRAALAAAARLPAQAALGQGARLPRRAGRGALPHGRRVGRAAEAATCRARPGT